MKAIKVIILLGGVMALQAVLVGEPAGEKPGAETPGTPGMLQAIGKEGKAVGACPLKHTDVRVSVSGHLAKVVVTQKFTNPFKEKIEAVYTFPLGASAAVTDMTMKIGDRVIRGQIKPREQARRIYEQAKARGHVASLLDQERPNIFTQAVANIEPGKNIDIQITYTEPLKYEDGQYSFAFPMVVGPRYIPGSATGRKGTGWAPDTTEVPDASKVTPPVTPEGTRAGHDISVRVDLNAGMEIKALQSKQHEVAITWQDAGRTKAVVELAKKKEIPNKDFVLEFSTASDQIEDALLAHTDKRGGYFMLVLQPPKKVQPKQIRPRELVFVLDTSGSMNGFPIETSKAMMRRAIKELRENDKFNIITFAGFTSVLWPKPVANTGDNRARALEFINSLKGAGGTEMMKAINACLSGPRDLERVRIVAFLTDGYVGNDMAIIAAVRDNVSTSRVFSFGIGTSVNRYLMDNMAREGRGEATYVLNQNQSAEAAEKFYDRINAPVLTDIEVDWGELADLIDAKELLPRYVPDLFSVQPVVISGRYKPSAGRVTGTVTLKGNTGEGKFQREVEITLPAAEPANAVAAPLWARAKVDYLMSQDLANIQKGKPDPAIKESIVGLGMSYRLLTQFTSFVAVEEKIVTIGGEPKTVAVPVEMPEGVSYEGVFGTGDTQGFGTGLSRLAAGGGGGGGRIHSLRMAKPALKRHADEAVSGAHAAQLQRQQIEAIKADKKLTDDQKKAKIAELKLAKALQGLAEKLDDEGNYSSGKVVVTGGKVAVAVYLEKLDADSLKELTELGFEKLLDSPGVKMVIGNVEVAKLADLAWLDNVRLIDLPDLTK
jgi:Ca-activated chloride channel family protein